jgi:glutaryl-CoA dehydrogenase
MPAAAKGAKEGERNLTALDFLVSDSLLSSDELLFRDSVRGFVADRILPGINGWFESGSFPLEIVPEMGRLGLLGTQIEGYGCPGSTATLYGLGCLELEAGDSAFRSFVSVQGSLVMFPIWKYGSEEQKREWLPRMAAGQAVGCFGLTEPESGSDPAAMRTTARSQGSDWVLNGSKAWITSGGIADVALIWARTEDGVRGFLIPRETKGFSTQDVKNKLSLRASVTSELVLHDCVVPESAMLPDARGIGGPLSCIDEARYGIVWGSLGAARLAVSPESQCNHPRVSG